MIYLDNAATSFPKPPEVIRAMAGVEEKMGANPGRGGHRLALRAGRVVEHCREEAARLLGVHHPERILFTANCTEALNLAISGTLRRGDEVICSYAEHNAVMRLLDRYVSRGEITVHMLAPDERGILSPASLRRVISRKTALVIIAHASNVTGLIQPIAQLGAVCRERGVPLLVDAAQTAGMADVSPDVLCADMVAMPGHKGLLGPQGTGLLVLGYGMNPEPLLLGGTGSMSESVRQPDMLPDRYESGEPARHSGAVRGAEVRAGAPGGNRGIRAVAVRPSARAAAGDSRRAHPLRRWAGAYGDYEHCRAGA